MKEPNIHPSAIVEPGATLGKGVTIEPYAIVKENVVLHDNVTVKSHAYLDGHTTIGEGTTIWPFACIGTKTQDLKYRGEKTFVTVGRNCEVREYVTINSSAGEGTVVSVGDGCLLMAYCHIAHNCEVGNHVIMSNNATLAGHVVIEDYAIIGGMTPIHQFVRIGAHSMVGGMSGVLYDIPPYTVGRGSDPYRLGGLNLVGLKRRGFSLETRQELSKAFRITFRSELKLADALERIEQELKPIPEIQHWLKFCRMTQRGIHGIMATATTHERGRAVPLASKLEAVL